MKPHLLPLALSLLAGCTFVGKDDWDALDQDGDGFMSADYPEGDDCDDGDPAVHPGAVEVCNGVDDDCEGTVDEDATDAGTWFTDSDGDGFGDDSKTVVACDAPTGTVSVGSDCDDDEDGAYPGAQEVCDQIDNDCDGLTDDDDSSVTGTTTWFHDADGDEYGDPADSVVGCEQPAGYIQDGTDCDDDDGSIHPAAEEIIDDGVDQDCDNGDACFLDSDLDGYGSSTMIASEDLDCQDEGESRTADDCDDASEGDFPGATEYCDGVDNDCDSVSDEDDAVDAEVWYRDADADGYGAVSDTHTACSAPEGYVGNDDDCDDSIPGVHPGATESVADGEDQDCDGGDTCFQDSDGDGFGDVVTVSSLDLDCTDLGEASVSGDCDDGLSTAHPGAGEYCDGTDNDCDGAVDEDDALDALMWYRDVDGDGYGDSADTATACVAPSGYVEEGGDCEDDLPEVNPGEDEVCNDGIDNNCDGSAAPFGIEGEVSLASADAFLSGASEENAGHAVSSADVNLDGVNDVIVGAQLGTAGGLQSGEVYIVSGPLSSAMSLSDADAVLVGEEARDEAGSSIAVGDLDGDGYQDVLVGAGQNGAGGYMSGAVYVVLAPVAGVFDLSSADSILIGESEWDQAGLAITAGDVDGDGTDDTIVGASGNDAGGSSSGAVYVVIGPSAGTAGLGAADAKLIGEESGDLAGVSVASGDVDGDGIQDLLVGAPCAASPSAEAQAGRTYLVYGPVTDSFELGSSDVEFDGEQADDWAGQIATGDVDGDGKRDVIIGAPSYDGSGNSVGAAYLVLSPFSGNIDLSLADAKLVGESDYDDAGGVVSSGDVNGDGIDDIIVGATTAGSSDSGAVYVEFGPVSGTMNLSLSSAVIVGENRDDRAGIAVFGADVNGDGMDDVLVGANAWNLGAGAAYLILGGGL